VRPLLAGFLLWPLATGLAAHASVYYVTVAGLGGEPDYDQRFTANAKDLDKLFKASGNGAHVYTLTGSQATRAQLTETLTTIARDAKPEDDLVLILIGHGSFDGADYKFNLVGPDITAAELASLSDRIPTKRQLIVNATSASGGSVAALEKPGRGVIAATKNGTEKNATVFARYWVEALQDPTADVDKSDSISAMEAFAYAQRKTAAFYESQKRLATEHAVFEDTGRSEPVREPSKNEGVLLTRSRPMTPPNRRYWQRKRIWSRRLTRSNIRRLPWTRRTTSSSLPRRWCSWRKCNRSLINELAAKIRCFAGNGARHYEPLPGCDPGQLSCFSQTWSEDGSASLLRVAGAQQFSLFSRGGLLGSGAI
jgi:hypothetical protein